MEKEGKESTTMTGGKEMKRYAPFTDGRRVILSKKSSSQLMKAGGTDCEICEGLKSPLAEIWEVALWLGFQLFWKLQLIKAKPKGP